MQGVHSIPVLRICASSVVLQRIFTFLYVYRIQASRVVVRVLSARKPHGLRYAWNYAICSLTAHWAATAFFQVILLMLC